MGDHCYQCQEELHLRERAEADCEMLQWKLGAAVAELEVALCSDWQVIEARLDRKWRERGRCLTATN